MKRTITHEELVNTLSYDESTGVFTWLKTNSNAAANGKGAGTINKGYVYITINKVKYLAHRLAWFYVNKEWPSSHLDHINNNRSDNRICNIREATPRQNAMNVSISKSNKTGYHGVHFDAAMEAWKAAVKKDRKNIHLGFFRSKDDAILAASHWRMKFFGDFAPAGAKDAFIRLSAGITDVDSYLESKKLTKGWRGSARVGCVYKQKRSSGSVFYEAISADSGKSLGRFDTEKRARVALKIYHHFFKQGFTDIPRTMSAVI